MAAGLCGRSEQHNALSCSVMRAPASMSPWLLDCSSERDSVVRVRRIRPRLEARCHSRVWRQAQSWHWVIC